MSVLFNCKGCAKYERGMILIYDHPRRIDTMFSEITGIQVNFEDYLCLDCYDELKLAYKFREKCLATNHQQSTSPLTEIIQQPVDFEVESSYYHPEEECKVEEVIINGPEANFNDEIKFDQPIEEDTPSLPIYNPNECDYCLEVFSDISDLLKHQANHNTETDARYCCVFDNCTNVFETREALLRHRKRHGLMVPLKCRFCSKFYYLKSSLTVHEKTHTEEIVFVCELCGVSFTQSLELKTHLATHHQECNTPPPPKINVLEKSSEIPTDFKAFSCKNCGKSFKTFAKLKTHAKTHEGTHRIFRCELCNVKYYYASGLNRHIRTNHPDTPEFVA